MDKKDNIQQIKEEFKFNCFFNEKGKSIKTVIEEAFKNYNETKCGI